MPMVQKGLETTAKAGVTLANYQESKVRWLHAMLCRVGGGLTCSACGIRSPERSTSRTATATSVVTTDDGRIGMFSVGGVDVDGEVYEADPQLCGWIGGPKVAHHRIQRPDDVADEDAPPICAFPISSGRTSAGHGSVTSTTASPRPARRAWPGSASTSSSTSACATRSAARPPTSGPCSTGTVWPRRRRGGRRLVGDRGRRTTNIPSGSRRWRTRWPTSSASATSRRSGPYDCGAGSCGVEASPALCDRAAEHGVLVGIEWLPYTNIANADDAQDDRSRRRSAERRVLRRHLAPHPRRQRPRR